MSDHIQDYLSNTLSSQERLANLQALFFGLRKGLELLTSRMASFHELLDLELGDESPAARLYLNQSLAAVQCSMLMLNTCAPAETYTSPENFESLNLNVLLKGMIARLNRSGYSQIEQAETETADQAIFLMGDLFLLQQLLLKLPELLNVAENRHGFYIRGGQQELGPAFFRGRKSPLTPGEYGIIHCCREQPEAPAEKWISLLERAAEVPGFPLRLSLIFAHGVLLHHGGCLLVPANAQNSTELLFAFPLRHNRVEMYDDHTLEDAELRGQETILLVDDEGIIWDVVIDMLQSLGYTVILAADGRDCVEIYRENPGEIDLVLLDMMMPEMDGHEAFQQLKKIDPQVKVLLSSGYVSEEDARDVLDAGALGFLRKPYRMVDLARRMRQIFDA